MTDFPHSMDAVLDLTKSGRLAQATFIIQQILANRVEKPRTPARPARLARIAFDPDRISPRGQTKVAGAAAPSFDWHQAWADTGSRRYRLYAPTTGAGHPRPLVVMLHGCMQTPDDFATGTRMNALADEMGFLVAYPEQPRSANASGCWNWFRRADQLNGRGEPALIAAIVAQVVRDQDVADGRVFIAGLSAGGAAAAVMGQTYPDLFAGVGIHSGLACGSAHDLLSAFTAMRVADALPSEVGRPVPTIVFHGTADRTVHPINASRIMRQIGATSLSEEVQGRSTDGTPFTRRVFKGREGAVLAEEWSVSGTGHAWFGGDPKGSYADPRGPDASREMVRFFLAR